jgi:hypothetical protein
LVAYTCGREKDAPQDQQVCSEAFKIIKVLKELWRVDDRDKGVDMLEIAGHQLVRDAL